MVIGAIEHYLAGIGAIGAEPCVSPIGGYRTSIGRYRALSNYRGGVKYRAIEWYRAIGLSGYRV